MQTLTERITIINDSSNDRNFAFFVPRDDIRFKACIHLILFNYYKLLIINDRWLFSLDMGHLNQERRHQWK